MLRQNQSAVPQTFEERDKGEARDKAAALASYAKQADDDELEKHALRVRARAIRRCGELLQQIDKGRGGRPIEETCSLKEQVFSPEGRSAAAREFGLRKKQKKTPSGSRVFPQQTLTKQ